MAAPDRHRTASDDVRTALLDAAERVLDRAGMDGFTIRTVATEARVAPMGVYSRFTNKDGLLTALAQHAFAALSEAIRVDEYESAPLRLREVCRRYRAFALTYPSRYRLMFSGIAEHTRPLAAVERSGIPAFDAFVDLVAELPDTHLSPRLTPLAATQILWRALHGAVTIEHAGLMRVPDPDSNFELFLDVTLAGLAARGNGSPE